MKRAICLCLLLVLAASTAAAAPALNLSDEQILSLFFPGQTASPADDFFYKMEPGVLGGDGYPSETRYKVKEVQPLSGKYVVVVEGRGSAHYEHYRNLFFGVYDPQRGALEGDVLAFPADWADYVLTYREGRLSLIYIGSTTYTGLEAFFGGCWDYADGQWSMIWPEGGAGSEAYYAFWDRRKAEILYDDLGIVRLYQRVPVPGGEGLGDYYWLPEDIMNVLYWGKEILP